MRICLLLIVALAGCRSGQAPTTTTPPASPMTAPPPSKPEAARPVRGLDELAAAVAAFKVRIASDPPAADRPEFVEPPSEAELAWVRDTATPLATRINRAVSLSDDTRAVMRRYVEIDLQSANADPQRAADSVATLRWSASAVRQFGALTSILVDEFLPTLSPSDPTYETRLGGLAKLGIGAHGMLQGALITLRAARSEVEARRQLAQVWPDQAATFARLVWNEAQCGQLRTWLDDVIGHERDAAIKAALQATKAAISRCESAR